MTKGSKINFFGMYLPHYNAVEILLPCVLLVVKIKTVKTVKVTESKNPRGIYI